MKTLAIRLDDDLHAQLNLVAKLQGVTVTEAIRTAIEAHVTQLAADPELSARAESVLAEIDREATERRAAISSLLGAKPGKATSKPTKATASRGPSREKG